MQVRGGHDERTKLTTTCHPYSLFDGQSARRHHHSAIIRSIENLKRLETTVVEIEATRFASPAPQETERVLDSAFQSLEDLRFFLNELHDLYGEPQS